MKTIDVQVNVEWPEGTAPEVVRRWIPDGLRHLVGVPATPSAGGGSLTGGLPVRCEHELPSRRFSVRPYSATVMTRIQESIAAGRDAAVYVNEGPDDPKAGFFNVAVSRPQELPWAFLEVGFMDSRLDDPSFETALVGHLKELLELANPGYGEISYSAGAWRSAYELVLATDDFGLRAIAQARTWLRGYTWLTICPQEIGERLGGLGYFRRTGAFHDASALREGGFWLQATEHYHQYDRAAASAVFQALAPALPSGYPDGRPPSTLARYPNIILRNPREVADAV